jgi:hypothetical protein
MIVNKFMGEKEIKINVITLTSKLYNVDIDEVVTAQHFPLDDKFTVGAFYGNKEMTVRIDRLYTGPSIPTKSFPRSFVLYICPDPKRQCNLVVVKMCINGVLHLTGCESEQQGNDICQRLAKICNETENIEGVTKTGIVEAEPCDIQMVNWCSATGYELLKDKLATLLQEHGYRVHKTTISPALKVWFMWNKKAKKPGVCNCSRYCVEGKGTGNGNGQCNRTTISILHTGIIHFMGSRTFEQMVQAHACIMEFMEKHRVEIARSTPEELMRIAMLNNQFTAVSV